jgi:peptidylprolyl isomerase
MQAKKGDTVKVHYKAKSQDSLIFDSSTQPEPLELVIGNKQVIPAFEKALIGMGIGEQKIVHIPSDKAFGPHLDTLISTISRDQLPKDLLLEVGQKLQVQQPDGDVILVTVKSLSDSDVTLDANHPLAGKDITFEINLIAIV